VDQIEVFLPTVGPDPDPTDEFGAAFTYNFDVEEGVPCFIDPFVAIGYDYAIGAEDTVKFATVTLPELEVGDNLFDLYLYDGMGWYLARKDLPAGELYMISAKAVWIPSVFLESRKQLNLTHQHDRFHYRIDLHRYGPLHWNPDTHSGLH
jgi:hypothetical protein